ncbi:MAG: hypothetical protein NZP34_10280 [Caldilineales bacterium]|nr:hypothetical protein [Caldilineales bacterium]MCX7852625.1 hypothetical protein [Caldilineales bacterium]
MIAFTSVVRPVVRLAGLGAVVLLLSGCAGRATPPAVSPSPEATATLPSPAPTVAVVTATPTAAPPTVALATPTAVAAIATPSEPTPTTAVVDWADFESRTADGFYERGNPDAAILIRDYSDFL